VNTANGCGAKDSVVNPPEFVFHGACNEHDDDYEKGEISRKEADQKFLSNMKAAARKRPWYYRPFYFGMAYVYYGAVRVRGGSRYNKGEAK
jgi:hypothetical protein